MDSLPTDIVKHELYKYIEDPNLIHLSMTCKRFFEIYQEMKDELCQKTFSIQGDFEKYKVGYKLHKMTDIIIPNHMNEAEELRMIEIGYRKKGDIFRLKFIDVTSIAYWMRMGFYSDIASQDTLRYCYQSSINSYLPSVWSCRELTRIDKAFAKEFYDFYHGKGSLKKNIKSLLLPYYNGNLLDDTFKHF